MFCVFFKRTFLQNVSLWKIFFIPKSAVSQPTFELWGLLVQSVVDSSMTSTGMRGRSHGPFPHSLEKIVKSINFFPRIMFFDMISFPSLNLYSNLDPLLTLQGLDFDEEREELSVPPTLPSALHSPPWALCSLVSPLDRIQFCFSVFVCLHCVLMFCRSHGCEILYPCKSRICQQI